MGILHWMAPAAFESPRARHAAYRKYIFIYIYVGWGSYRELSALSKFMFCRLARATVEVQLTVTCSTVRLVDPSTCPTLASAPSTAYRREAKGRAAPRPNANFQQRRGAGFVRKRISDPPLPNPPTKTPPPKRPHDPIFRAPVYFVTSLPPGSTSHACEQTHTGFYTIAV